MGEDWVDEKAREWLEEHYKGRGWDDEDAASLAALLREVDKDARGEALALAEDGPYIRWDMHRKDKALDRTVLLTSVLGLVSGIEKCSPGLGDDESGFLLACKEIRTALEKLNP